MIIEIPEKELKEWITFCLDLDWEGDVTLRSGKKGKFKARIPNNLQKKIIKGMIEYLKVYEKK